MSILFSLSTLPNWSLSNQEIISGTRESILADFKAGKYDGVVAIYRTFDSAQVRICIELLRHRKKLIGSVHRKIRQGTYLDSPK